MHLLIVDDEPHVVDRLGRPFRGRTPALHRYTNKNGQPLSSFAGEDAKKLAASVPFRSMIQLKHWSQRILNRLKEETERENRDNRAELIREIHKFIEEHLTDVSLQTIADHVSMHPVYISKIYNSTFAA